MQIHMRKQSPSVLAEATSKASSRGRLQNTRTLVIVLFFPSLLSVYFSSISSPFPLLTSLSVSFFFVLSLSLCFSSFSLSYLSFSVSSLLVLSQSLVSQSLAISLSLSLSFYSLCFSLSLSLLSLSLSLLFSLLLRSLFGSATAPHPFRDRPVSEISRPRQLSARRRSQNPQTVAMFHDVSRATRLTCFLAGAHSLSFYSPCLCAS